MCAQGDSPEWNSASTTGHCMADWFKGGGEKEAKECQENKSLSQMVGKEGNGVKG